MSAVNRGGAKFLITRHAVGRAAFGSKIAVSSPSIIALKRQNIKYNAPTPEVLCKSASQLPLLIWLGDYNLVLRCRLTFTSGTKLEWDPDREMYVDTRELNTE
jgi:hypothetical protein